MGELPDLKRLRRLAEAASPGPWRWRGCEDRDSPNPYRREGNIEGPEYLPIPDTVAMEPADAEYVAAMDPTTTMALLDYIERLWGA